MKYDLEYSEGGECYLEGLPRAANPYIFKTCQWYAWDAGWGRAESEMAVLDLDAAAEVYGEAHG